VTGHIGLLCQAELVEAIVATLILLTSVNHTEVSLTGCIGSQGIVVTR
jgi:hypothetical protein